MEPSASPDARERAHNPLAAELRVAQQELSLRNRAMDSAPMGLAILDLQGNITYVNEAFSRLTGVSREQAVGMRAMDTALYGPRGERIFAEILECGFWQGTLDSQRPDGSVQWTRVIAGIIRDEAGEPLGIMASFADVTERRAARHALHQSERQYRELVENANSIILRLDRQGRMTFVNRFACDFFGYTEAELLGKHVLATIIPRENSHGRDMSAFVEDLVRDPGRYANSENENITRDGRRVWVSWTNRALLDDSGDFNELLCVGNDITRRKQAEQQLRIYGAALESAIDAIGFAGLDGVINWVNAAYLRLWGLDSLDDVVGENIKDYMLPEEADRIMAALMATGTFQGERPATRKDGSTFYIEVSANVVRNEHGTPLCLMASFADRTKRKQAEAELRQFKAITDQAGYGSVIVNADYHITYCNKSYARMHGYERDALLGQPVWLLYPDQLETVALLENELRGGRQLVSRHMWRQRKDGTTFPALTNISPLRAESGQVIYSATIMDITQLTEAVEGLAAEKERLAVTLRSISDGVIATDNEGKVTLLSAEAEALTGWNRNEALGQPAEQVYRLQTPSAGRPCPHPVTHVLTEGTPVDLVDCLMLSRDGSERAVAHNAAPITDAEGKHLGVVLVFRDVTERRRLREAAYQAHKLESLGLLAGGIAHDFNNLLTSLLGQIGLARNEAADAPKVVAELDAAEKVALQARNLSQQLLTFSRGGTPVKVPLHLGDLLAGTASFALSGSNVGAELDLAPSLWPVEADEGQIIQVVNNLVLNAKQAMPRGGTVRVRATNVTLKAPTSLPLPPGRYVEVQVSDHGPGIPPEIAGRVFDPYFTTKQGGSGLGLTIVYSVITKHGGHITLQSAPREGVTFRFWLPATAREPLRPAAAEQAPAGSGRVLVMDDDSFIRKVVSPMLKQLGYLPEIVTSSREAVAALQASDTAPFAAVILDLTIKGGEGGVETLAKLRELQPTVKALACSGYCTDPVMANYHDYGFDGIIVKPYRLQDLAQGLEAVLKP